MNTYLMYRDKSLDVPESFPYTRELLLNDLELNVLLDNMAQGDEDMRKACRAALLQPLTHKKDILYRQEILKELIQEPEFAREVYSIAVDMIHRRRTEHVWLQSQMNALFRGAVGILRMTTEGMRKLRLLAEKYTGKFRSEGLARHGLRALDEALLELIAPRVGQGMPFLLLLTKADKLSSAEQTKALQIARLQTAGGQAMLFSSLRRKGLADAALWLRRVAAGGAVLQDTPQ